MLPNFCRMEYISRTTKKKAYITDQTSPSEKNLNSITAEASDIEDTIRILRSAIRESRRVVNYKYISRLVNSVICRQDFKKISYILTSIQLFIIYTYLDF